PRQQTATATVTAVSSRRRLIRSLRGLVDLFFLQAEDGIRDRNVTGVQTCALPISGEARVSHAPGPRGVDLLEARVRGDVLVELRSEERRVGKEGRSGGGRA